MKSLRLVLGDQLSHNLSTFGGIDPENDLILICELKSETSYVKHHKKKIAFLFSAMRHFADELVARKYNVRYVKFDDHGNSGSFAGEIDRIVEHQAFDQLVITNPGEFRLLEEFQSWQKENKWRLKVQLLEDNRFYTTIQDFKDWASGRKELRMEFFYRENRKRFDILMEGSKPSGGKWNYDADNRKVPPSDIEIPAPLEFPIDAITQSVLDLVSKEFDDHFGDLYPFTCAVTREQALLALDDFILNRLKDFGSYQDAMLDKQPFMFHSLISFYLNCGLLDPLECVQRAEQHYESGLAPLNSVEGFIRQILGWREFIRGFYWAHMPKLKSANFLEAKRPLPDFYWTGKTKMNCLSQCVKTTRRYAYAHHIQRLMVLGNFATLAGIHPDDVNEWFLIVYGDAYEWVELPNVSSMALYADGGRLASKPYIAGGNYIKKMSNYCHACQFSVTDKTGEKACPFNYLYWNFLILHEEKLRKNQRLSMAFRSLNKMSDEKKESIRASSENFFHSLKTPSR